jgi:signal transduction histidine kinase
MEKEQPDIAVIIVGCSALFICLSAFLVVFILKYWEKQSVNQKKISELQFNFQKELLRTQLEIQEQTFQNISQEIHDNIGQTLSLVKLNLNTISTEPGPRNDQKITTSLNLVSKAINDLRSISKTLNTDMILSAGFLNALEFELQLIEKTGIFQTSLSIDGQSAKLDPKKELILFRIVQEALNNIIKHSSASSISVKAIFEKSRLCVSVSDDGTGFSPDESNNIAGRGSGLSNMNKRARLIGGTLLIESNPSGTTIHLTIPTDEYESKDRLDR